MPVGTMKTEYINIQASKQCVTVNIQASKQCVTVYAPRIQKVKSEVLVSCPPVSGVSPKLVIHF